MAESSTACLKGDEASKAASLKLFPDLFQPPLPEEVGISSRAHEVEFELESNQLRERISQSGEEIALKYPF